MFKRLCNPLKERSFFLFGARGTGKTHLLRQFTADRSTLWVDLLNDKEALPLMRDSSLLERHIASALKNTTSVLWVVIDEVQKVPALLDEVHRLLEEPAYRNKIRFALTGSSARKLKRGAANMLGGRALLNYLFPLTHTELDSQFELEPVLRWGALPAVVQASSELEKSELLRSYVSVYLKEEIKEEQLVRKLDPFVRFLEVAAQMNGELLNFSKIGRDCLVDEKQVVRYFQILEDTLLGFFLEPFHESIRKRQSTQPKFYLFDLGVKRALESALTSGIISGSSEFGRAFEHMIILECIRLNHYLKKDFRFSFFRSSDGFEIDLIVERPGKPRALVEIKSAAQPDPVQVRKLGAVVPDFKNAQACILCQARRESEVNGVTIFPWQQGIDWLFEL